MLGGSLLASTANHLASDVSAPFRGSGNTLLASAIDGAFPGRYGNSVSFGLDAGTAVGGLALGGIATARSVFTPLTVAESGSGKFLGQGFNPAQAEYLAMPYPLTGKGHHSFITQAMGRKYNLPKWVVDNPLNVLKPNGISRGDFYELHYKVDPYFFNANFPTAIGGSWRGSSLGLEKYGTAGRIWYSIPTSLKVTVGGAGAAEGAGAYYYFGGRK